MHSDPTACRSFGGPAIAARGAPPSHPSSDAHPGSREMSSMLDESTVHRVLTAGLERGADFAEIFAEDRRLSSASLDDGKVEELTSGRDRGAGIRVVVGESTGFAHTSDLSEEGLLAAARVAGAAARGSSTGTKVIDLERGSATAP